MSSLFAFGRGGAKADRPLPAMARRFSSVRLWWKADVAEAFIVLHQEEMERSRSAITAVVLSGLVISCATATVPSFNVVVRGPAPDCSIAVEGRKVTTNELFEIAKLQARSGRRAHIDSDMARTPYRCLGGAIYTLQRAGFKKIGFVAEPPP